MKKDPKTGKSVRDYKKQTEWQSRPDRVQKRVENNKARQEMIKDGKAKVGDGKDVDHKKPLSKGGSGDKSNLRVVDRSSNRSFSRTSDSKVKSQTSRRERKK